MADSTPVTFKTKFDYALNLVGIMVGFSNIWRFPYICYKNGGGAFILAYVILVVVVILPLAAIEGALGQYTGKSVIKVWNVIPLLKGIGFTAPFMMIYWNTVLSVLMSWVVRWLGASFSSDPIWMECNNTWNTEGCVPVLGTNDTRPSSIPYAQNVSLKYRSSVEEYFTKHLLGKSAGLEEYGTIKPDLLLCLAIVWIAAYFAVWKGIGWTSKVVYVTATVPILMLVVLVIRGATLDGAENGIIEYLKPDPSKLLQLGVWSEASSQVLFSFGVCTGGLPTLSKFNAYKHNYLRDMVILLISNAATSFIAGFACFSVLGHLALKQNVTIADVADKGPELVFVVYPTAMSLLPGHQVWCPLFFIMMLLIGFDSLFVYHETFVCCIRDVFPEWFRFRYANEVWIGATGFVLFLFGLTMITNGGIYVLEILNNYGVTGWCVFFISLVEFIAIGWVFGSSNLCDIIEDMIGYRLGHCRTLFHIVWKYLGPAISMLFTVYSLSLYRALKYDAYVYPPWANALGWIIALSSALAIPVTAALVLYKVDGDTLKEKLTTALKKKDMKRPVDSKGPDDKEERLLSTEF